MKELILLNPKGRKVRRATKQRALRVTRSKKRNYISRAPRSVLARLARKTKVGSGKPLTLYTNPPYSEGYDEIFRKPRKTRKTKFMAKTKKRRKVSVRRHKHRTFISGVPRRAVKSLARKYRARTNRPLTIRTNPIADFRQVFGLAPMAGGVLASSIATNFVMSKFGAKLPMSDNKFVRAAYYLTIPLVAATVVKKVVKGKNGADVATGMILGGLANSIGSVVNNFVRPGAMRMSAPAITAPVAATSEYLGEYLGDMPDALNEYLDPVHGGAFDNDAWAN